MYMYINLHCTLINKGSLVLVLLSYKHFTIESKIKTYIPIFQGFEYLPTILKGSRFSQNDLLIKLTLRFHDRRLHAPEEIRLSISH